MSEKTNRIAGLIVDAISDKISVTGENQLKDWSTQNHLNKSLLKKLTSTEERDKRIVRYQSAASTAIWNKIRQNARDEIGHQFALKASPYPRFSPAVQTLILSVMVIAVMALAATVYISLSYINDKQVPGKSVQKVNYRF